MLEARQRINHQVADPIFLTVGASALHRGPASWVTQKDRGYGVGTQNVESLEVRRNRVWDWVLSLGEQMSILEEASPFSCSMAIQSKESWSTTDFHWSGEFSTC